jgi:hypothetical protein
MTTEMKHLSLIVVVAAFSACQAAAIAQQNCAAPSSHDAFKLSAMYTASPSLSRSEIDPNAVQAPARLADNAPGRIANNVVTSASLPQVKAQPPKLDKSYLQEYNVDWSRWISAQADRWYYTLKSTETFLGAHFVTVRPAMIEFTCYADGTIANVALRQSSGNPVYDRLQIEALLATSPTLPFPAGTQRSSITLCQGWESHAKQPGESDFEPGSFGRNFPQEKVRQWCVGRD